MEDAEESSPVMSMRLLTEVQLVARVAAACREERRLTAEIVACLLEVDRRRIHLRGACSSLFDYCTRILGMSGGAAHRRINAARLVKRFPCLLPMLARGELHLCGLLILRDHFTEANVEELASAASGLSEAKIRELLVARSPRAPVPERIRPAGGQAPLPVVDPAPLPRTSYTAPLSPTMYELQLTMTAETHAKLRRAQDMMRHRQLASLPRNVGRRQPPSHRPRRRSRSLSSAEVIAARSMDDRPPCPWRSKASGARDAGCR